MLRRVEAKLTLDAIETLMTMVPAIKPEILLSLLHAVYSGYELKEIGSMIQQVNESKK